KQEDALAVAEEVAREVREQGHTAYLVAVGGSMPLGSMDLPLGAISYVSAYVEMVEQAKALGVQADYVVHSSGSGATQAGLVVGAQALTRGAKVLGISVSDDKVTFGKDVLKIVQATEKALKLETHIKADDVIVFDEYIKDGYGIVNQEVADMIRLVFTKEGIVLDPVYTAKAMAGLVDLIKKGYFEKTDKVVFFHTGGTPALFPNKHKLVEYLK
ncbi:MAG: pyridoxal-phosphate dependent enzyme, partial [Candidatus Aminicenantes bacterium]|nr:pyridoxal-phosphate dependent enzyme [Candidatus Aminicenantes bacterium]